jgi:hypothetical protein
MYSQMSSNNRFQALAEVDDEQLLQIAETHLEEASQTQSGKEGWDDKIVFSDGEDFEEQVTIEVRHRRRKVSLGPRDAPNPNMTLTFPPASTRSMVPGRGRGGGLVFQPQTAIGLLPPISENVEVEREDEAEPEMTEKDANLIKAGVALLDLATPEKQVTTFTFRAQLTWGLE